MWKKKPKNSLKESNAHAKGKLRGAAGSRVRGKLGGGGGGEDVSEGGGKRQEEEMC